MASARTAALRPRRPRLLFLVSEDGAFLTHRAGLARRAVLDGWDVHVACQATCRAAEIADLGVTLHTVPLSRGSVNPWREATTMYHLRRVLRRLQPDVVHQIAIKPVIYGGLMARTLPHHHTLSLIAGLGSNFSGGSAQTRTKQAMLSLALRMATRGRGHRVVVQNRDDYGFVTRHRIASPPDLCLIPGSGIDSEAYHPRPSTSGEHAPAGQQVMRVALVARMLTDKGVRDSVAAMGILAERDAPVHLLLVGGPDPENPSSISENELRSWESERVTWLGPRRDVAEILATCDVGLLPSYREGMPRSLLEAASCGLPVVTTDVPGCRELVSDGVNGLVVPVRDPVALADALERLAGSPAERARMGRNARRIVLERYCDAVILDQFMALYRQGLSRPTTSPAEAADVSPTVLDIRQRQRHRATAHEIGDRHP